ncbi:hypothetical Protein YC6258_05902 [Gynuella sunshinyii YC6258]|uniref:Uncharacterized protein n=2 Tax=Gynuella sunshinyii TaxID=1445505 RepID=A0A0C5VX72_9GAMM|nr:hypothetical Protein YC6258_05902 [Gynuella sunshinyii YC6258]
MTTKTILAAVGIIFWLMGYCIPADSGHTSTDNVLNAFCGLGLLIDLSPYVLVSGLNNIKATTSALTVSITLFILVSCLFICALIIGCDDEKAGEYWILRHIYQLQQETGWLFLFLGSALLIVTVKQNQSRNNHQKLKWLMLTIN